MYGLINQGLKDMVCSAYGYDAWRDICLAVGISVEDFNSLNSYPDSTTLNLISAVSDKCRLPTSEILAKFGRHWIIYTAQEGYGPIMDLFGSDLRSCLKNLNRMHGHMGAMMPGLKPPRFTVDEHSQHLITVHYYSTRVGLGAMVVGLLEGLAEKFGELVSIAYIPIGERSDHDEFDVHFR